MSAQNFQSKKFFSSILILTLLVFVTPSFAQEVDLKLPSPSKIKAISKPFTPVLIKAVTVNPNDPFLFDFIIDKGDSTLSDEAFEAETQKLVKYFLAALTIPENDLWVNLSPYEQDAMVPRVLGVTELGKDLLVEDYYLKQVTAQLTNPNTETGKKFWKLAYAKAQEMYGTTQVPINTFSKIWIVPDQAMVLEKDGSAFVASSHLKVFLDQDYLAVKKNLDNKEIGTDKLGIQKTQDINSFSSQIIKDVVLPEIEKEINAGENFASVRQIYNSAILAAWYKKRLKESLLGKIYVDQNKVAGVNAQDMDSGDKIFEKYTAALKTGAYNIIKQDYDLSTQKVVQRKYFSGGVKMAPTRILDVQPLSAERLASLPAAANDTFMEQLATGTYGGGFVGQGRGSVASNPAAGQGQVVVAHFRLERSSSSNVAQVSNRINRTAANSPVASSNNVVRLNQILPAHAANSSPLDEEVTIGVAHDVALVMPPQDLESTLADLGVSSTDKERIQAEREASQNSRARNNVSTPTPVLDRVVANNPRPFLSQGQAPVGPIGPGGPTGPGGPGGGGPGGPGGIGTGIINPWLITMIRSIHDDNGGLSTHLQREGYDPTTVSTVEKARTAIETVVANNPGILDDPSALMSRANDNPDIKNFASRLGSPEENNVDRGLARSIVESGGGGMGGTRGGGGGSSGGTGSTNNTSSDDAFYALHSLNTHPATDFVALFAAHANWALVVAQTVQGMATTNPAVFNDPTKFISAVQPALQAKGIPADQAKKMAPAVAQEVANIANDQRAAFSKQNRALAALSIADEQTIRTALSAAGVENADKVASRFVALRTAQPMAARNPGAMSQSGQTELADTFSAASENQAFQDTFNATPIGATNTDNQWRVLAFVPENEIVEAIRISSKATLKEAEGVARQVAQVRAKTPSAFLNRESLSKAGEEELADKIDNLVTTHRAFSGLAHQYLSPASADNENKLRMAANIIYQSIPEGERSGLKIASPADMHSLLRTAQQSGQLSDPRRLAPQLRRILERPSVQTALRSLPGNETVVKSTVAENRNLILRAASDTAADPDGSKIVDRLVNSVYRGDRTHAQELVDGLRRVSRNLQSATPEEQERIANMPSGEFKTYLVAQGVSPEAANAYDERKLGGIDLSSEQMDLKIKRDGKGVVLPVSDQDIRDLNVEGLEPVMLKYQPATPATVPFLMNLSSSAQSK